MSLREMRGEIVNIASRLQADVEVEVVKKDVHNEKCFACPHARTKVPSFPSLQPNCGLFVLMCEVARAGEQWSFEQFEQGRRRSVRQGQTRLFISRC